MAEQRFGSRKATYLGRNGFGTCIGVNVYNFRDKEEGNTIRIYPINTKGQDARCFIGIPEELTEAVIASLRQTVGGMEPWVEDPEFPVSDWQAEVWANDTRRGYVEWVAACRELVKKGESHGGQGEGI